MFENLVTNKKMMAILSWMLAHPEGVYNARVIAASCGISSPYEFVHYLVILHECDIVDVDSESEKDKLCISLKDSEIVEQLQNMRAFIENKIAGDMATINAYNLIMEEDVFNRSPMSKDELSDIIDDIKHYERFNDLDDPVKMLIYESLKQIDDEGRLDEFLEHVENMGEMQ